MADIENTVWSETDSSNTSLSPYPGWPSSTMLPTQVEPSARAMMGAIKRFWDRINGTLNSTGSAGAYALTYSVAPATYVQGQRYSFTANFTSVGGDTLNVNSLGALALYKPSDSGPAAIVANDIVSAQRVNVEYDSALNAGAGGFHVLSGITPNNFTGFTAHAVLVGEGSAPVSSISPGAAGNLLTSNGATSDPSFQSPTLSGFINKLRNSSQVAWFHGTSITITTSGGWASEGIYVVPAGASVAVAQIANPLTSPLTFYGTKITGATSVTDVTARFVIESFDAAPLAGQTVTIQVPIQNNTGGSITPTLTVKRATAGQDNYSTTATDVNAVNLQTVASGSTATLAYTFSANTASYDGLSIDIDFGNNFSANTKNIVIGGGFDLRATPGVATGLNAAPPTPEIRTAAADIEWCRRFYRTTYDNGVAPGTSTVTGIVGGMGGYYNGASVSSPFAIPLGAPMRADPSVSYWDSVGNGSKVSKNENGTWTNNLADISSVTPGQQSLLFFSNATDAQLFLHYAADATIVGG